MLRGREEGNIISTAVSVIEDQVAADTTLFNVLILIV